MLKDMMILKQLEEEYIETRSNLIEKVEKTFEDFCKKVRENGYNNEYASIGFCLSYDVAIYNSDIIEYNIKIWVEDLGEAYDLEIEFHSDGTFTTVMMYTDNLIFNSFTSALVEDIKNTLGYKHHIYQWQKER